MTPKRIALAILILAFICLGNAFLTGCASKPKPIKAQFSAPSFVGVEQKIKTVGDSIKSAAEKAKKIQAEGVQPNAPIMAEMLADLERGNAAKTAAEVELAAKSQESAAQTELLNKVIEEKNTALVEKEYWHGKHVKGLKEIWFWRFLAAGILATIGGWFVLKMGWKLA